MTYAFQIIKDSQINILFVCNNLQEVVTREHLLSAPFKTFQCVWNSYIFANDSIQGYAEYVIIDNENINIAPFGPLISLVKQTHRDKLLDSLL